MRGERSGRGIERIVDRNLNVDREVYEGEFLSNLRHGRGKFLNISNNYSYQGKWHHGVPTGMPSSLRLRLPKKYEDELGDDKKEKKEKKGGKEDKKEEKSRPVSSGASKKKSKKQVQKEKEEQAQRDLESVRGASSCEVPDPANKGALMTVIDFDLCDPIEVHPGASLAPIFLCLCDKAGSLIASDSGRKFELRLAALTPQDDEEDKAKTKRKKKVEKRAPEKDKGKGKAEEEIDDVQIVNVFFCTCSSMSPEEIRAFLHPPTEDGAGLTAPTSRTSESRLNEAGSALAAVAEASNVNDHISESAATEEATGVESETACLGACVRVKDESTGHLVGTQAIERSFEGGGSLCIDKIKLADKCEPGKYNFIITDVTFPLYRYEDVLPDSPHPATLVARMEDDNGVPIPPPVVSKADCHPACLQSSYIRPAPKAPSRLSLPVKFPQAAFSRPLPTIVVPFEIQVRMIF